MLTVTVTLAPLLHYHIDEIYFIVVYFCTIHEYFYHPFILLRLLLIIKKLHNNV